MIFSLESAGLAPPVILFLALLLDAVVGEFGPLFRVIPHPVAILGGLTGWFDRRLNRENRSARTRLVRGLMVAFLMIALAIVIGWVLHDLARQFAYG